MGKDFKKIAIIGAGKYGTALCVVLMENETFDLEIVFLTRLGEKAEEINTLHTLSDIAEGVTFTANVSATTEAAVALNNADAVLLCTPTQAVPDFFETHKELIEPKTIILNTTKGMIVKTGKLVHEAYEESFPGQLNRYAALSGPSFADETYKRMPTLVTIASTCNPTLDFLQELLCCSHFKCYTSNDLKGVELSGCLSRVITMGAGFVVGLGYGPNSIAGVITRGIHEMQILLKNFGGDIQTMMGLAGIGDLMLCCYGSLSRNRACGMRVAKGEKVDDVIKSIGTVEGITTLRVLYKMIQEKRLEEQLPVFYSIYQLIHEQWNFTEAHEYLMKNRMQSEDEFL